MPRLNDVFLVGVVADIPSVKRDAAGKIVQLALPIFVTHGERSSSERLITGNYDRKDIKNRGDSIVYLLTGNEEITEKMAACKTYDIVEVKGVLRVRPVTKKSICPECGAKHLYPSTKTTVYPQYFALRESLAAKYGVSDFAIGAVSETLLNRIEKESWDKLGACVEISDLVKLIGVICREPELYQKDGSSLPILTFPLAVKRHYYIGEDAEDIKADFPYIKIYGSQAVQQQAVLSRANLIMIDGYLQTRSIIRKIVCENCDTAYRLSEQVTEVVPHFVEYIRSNISDTEFTKGERPYQPRVIGSEADIDLALSAEERADSNIASGAGGLGYDEDIARILDTLE